MAERHTFEVIARHIIKAAAPLIEAGTSLGSFQRMMARLGFAVTSIPAPFATLSVNTKNAQFKVDGFAANAPLADVLALLSTAKGVFDGIRGVAGGPPPAGADPAAWSAEIGDGLFNLLFSEYFAAEFGATFNVLKTLGVIKIDAVPGTATRPSFMRPTFSWPELSKLVSDPSGFPSRVFKWGTPAFQGRVVIDQLAEFLAGLHFPVQLKSPDEQILRGYLGIPGGRVLFGTPSLHMPFIYVRVADKTLEAAFDIHALGPVGGKLPGIAIEPRIPAEFPLALQLHPKVKMRLRAGTNAATPLGIVLRPNDVSVKSPLSPGTPPPTAGIGVGFDFGTGADPITLLGDPGSSRIEFAGASIDLNADYANGAWSVTLAPELRGLRFVLDPGEGDSFIRYIVGKNKATIDMPLGLEWSQKNGIRFRGSAALEVSVNPHVTLGPISIDEIDIALAIPLGGPGAAVRLDIGAGISGTLGPLSFLLKGIGLRTDFVFTPGNAGPIDIKLGFKPPTGMGLSLDAGGFKGGGFLFFDAANAEYAGGLELMFLGFVSVRAVGILSTRLPDGSEGFSLLLIIVSEFPPLQLSWGFTLLGVGGLLGLNRTVILDALQVGVRDGTLNSIMFPKDIVANASRIVNDLKRVFPPMSDRFLIGPMAKLGWGTPTLVSLEIGFILEIPRPAFAIVGVLRVNLPAEALPLIFFQVNFAGSVDFEKGQLQFDASLYNSHVLIYPITGDLCVRVYWGENPNFLLSVGGFHPAFTPPPMNIGQMSRLGMVIYQGIPNIRAEVYFAVTSNTVQLGARLELYAGVDIFNVYGFLALDVLIQFNPFHFVTELSAMLALRTGSDVLFGVRLNMTFEGPAPWHARGDASFEIGFIITVTFHVGFDVTIGDAEQAKLEPIEVLHEIENSLQQIANWRARLPPTSNQHVTLREFNPPADTLVLHPFGALEASQKVAPLDEFLQRFGARRPAVGHLFHLSGAKLGTENATTSPTSEQFAPAQFFDMSDAEKLSRPSFAYYHSGAIIGGDLAPRAEHMRVRKAEYECIYLPEHSPLRVLVAMVKSLFSLAAGTGAVGQSSLSHSQRAPSALAVGQAAATQEKYAVVSTLDLSLHENTLVFDNASSADRALQDLLARRPELTAAIQVMPWSKAA